MLKLNYTEDGLHIEQITDSLQQVIAQRVVLALRLGQPLFLEPGCASFLLPANLPELSQLEIALQQEGNSAVTIVPVDDEFVEVGLSGIWVAQNREAHAGIFLSAIEDCVEFYIYKLWQMSNTRISFLA